MQCDHEERLCRMERNIVDILTILEKIDQSHHDVETSCKRMDDHITFIDTIYSRLRAPLSWVLSRTGNTSDLPQIQDGYNPKVVDTNLVR
jgi:hypothetical protein